MKLSQMRYFFTTCHLGSITQAAESLHISQPAITTAIQALEQELGILLLNRGKRSVTPTPDGELFFKRCDVILADVDSLSADFQELSRRHNTIPVGLPPMVGFFRFPKIFAEFTRSHPEIHMKLTEVGSETAKDMVKRGELELAIIAMGETAPASSNAQSLIRTQMMYCVSKDGPLTRWESVTLEDVAKAPLILFTSGYYHQELLQNRFRGTDLTPNVLFHSGQLLTIKSFLRKNLTGTFLLSQAIEPSEPIVALPMQEPLLLNIAVVWQKDVFITREARQFIRFMKSRMEQP